MKQLTFNMAIRLICLAGVTILFFGCTDYFKNRKINEGFPPVSILKPEKIKINEVLKPGAIVLLEDFLIVQNEYNPKEDCFFVYTRDKIKFCYSFGSLGQSGTDYEYIAPRVIQNNSGNIFTVFDQSTRSIYYYDMMPDRVVFKKKERINDKDETRFPLQEISFVNDSILLFTTLFGDICSYNIAADSIIDRKHFVTGLKEELGANHPIDYEGFQFSNKGNRIVIGFMFINKVITGELDHHYYMRFNQEKITANVSDFDQDKYSNTVYYMFMLSSDKYIYAQYMGLPFKVFQPFPLNLDGRNFKTLMEVYDWEMNKKALIDFNLDVLRFTMDEKNTCLYTWNPLEDFDYLYKYPLWE
ncbi:MAG: hypothetical protein LBQ39_05365 [Tannerellaceae bacterium]|jgi:hypothetical protein|nr:hypothetical protein [Tannerellaceae bacterium]